MKISALSILPVLLCMLTGCKWNSNRGEEEAKAYELLTVKKENFEVQSEYSAQIKGRQDIRIIPRVDGYLEKILVKEGENVKKDQLLFVVDQTAYKAAVKNAEAVVLQSKAVVEKLALELEGKVMLHKQKVISDLNLKLGMHNLEAAKADLEAAKANLVSAKNNLSFTELRSPSDGVIGSIPYRKGDYVGPTTQDGLTIVSDNSEMYVYFSMSEIQVMEYLTEYGSMQDAINHMPQPQILLSGSKLYPHTGKIESISGIVDENTGAVSVRAVFPNPDGLLLSGGTAVILFPHKLSDVIIIPMEATYEVLDKKYVFKVKDGIAESSIVETEKLNDRKRYIVKSGLESGEVIIAKGAGLVQEGSAVKGIE